MTRLTVAVMAIALLSLMGSMRLYEMMRPWEFAAMSDTFDLSGEAGPILAGARLERRAAGRRDGEAAAFVLAGANREGGAVSLELSPLAAYALHEHVHGGNSR